MQLYRTVLLTAVLAFAAPYIYGRLFFLYIFYTNSPSRMSRVVAFSNLTSTSDNYRVVFEDRLRNCEHFVFVEEAGLAVLGCDPGRDRWNAVMGLDKVSPAMERGGLWLYDYTSVLAGDKVEGVEESLVPIKISGYPTSSRFHPLGIAYHYKSGTLTVANHHPDGSRLDVFHLDLSSRRRGLDELKKMAKAAHIRSLIDKKYLAAPNSIVAVGQSTLLVTNDHAFPYERYGNVIHKMENYLALPGGSVVVVNYSGKKGPIKARCLARVSFANGIALYHPPASPESEQLVVASSAGANLHVFDINRPGKGGKWTAVDASAVTLRRRKTIRVPFAPDNLSSTPSNGYASVLVGGHPHPPSLDVFGDSRTDCNGPAATAADTAKCAPDKNAPSWVAEWGDAPASKGKGAGVRRDLYVETEYPSVCSAARDMQRGVGIVSGLYAKGILVWKD